MNKNCFIGLIAASLFALAGTASAALLDYDITVSGGWFDSDGNPYSMPFSPTLTGTMRVDNTQSGAAALVDFSLTTGTKTWTESEFVGATSASFSFDGSGDLTSFELDNFSDATGSMYIYSNNTFAVFEVGLSPFNACNDCVSFAAAAPAAIPEPSTCALGIIGLLGLCTWRRRKRS